MDYFHTLVEGDVIAVARGKCDCAAPIDHPLVMTEIVTSISNGVIETHRSFYKLDGGFEIDRLEDCEQDDCDDEYHRILDPGVSLDGNYAILNTKAVTAEDKFIRSGMIKDKRDRDLLFTQLDALALQIYNRI